MTTGGLSRRWPAAAPPTSPLFVRARRTDWPRSAIRRRREGTARPPTPVREAWERRSGTPSAAGGSWALRSGISCRRVGRVVHVRSPSTAVAGDAVGALLRDAWGLDVVRLDDVLEGGGAYHW